MSEAAIYVSGLSDKEWKILVGSNVFLGVRVNWTGLGDIVIFST